MAQKGPPQSGRPSSSTGERKDLKNLLPLWPYLKKYPGHLAVLGGAVLSAAVSMLIFGKSLELLVDTSLQHQGVSFLKGGLLGLLALVSCLACASYLRLRAITFLGETAICEIKKDIFKRLLFQPYEFFETHKTGDLLSRLNSDTLLLQMLISNSIPIACRNILMGVGSIVLLFITHFYLTLYVFLLAPLILFLVFSLGKRVKERAKKTQKEISCLTILTEESLAAIRDIQAFNQEEDQFLLINTRQKKLLKALFFK